MHTHAHIPTHIRHLQFHIHLNLYEKIKIERKDDEVDEVNYSIFIIHRICINVLLVCYWYLLHIYYNNKII